MAAFQVPDISLDVRRAAIELLALRGLRRREAGRAALVRDCGLLEHRHDVRLGRGVRRRARRGHREHQCPEHYERAERTQRSKSHVVSLP
jgi:hypothetical protein